MKVVDRNHCGGETTVWMNDNIPLPGTQANNTFCYNHIAGVHDGCLWTDRVPVKNCGGYLVYYFPLKSIACPMVVCTDPSIQPCPLGEVSKTGFKPCKKVPCPKDKWSATGFEPCVDPFPVVTNVTLSGPDEIHGDYKHTCHVTSNDTSRDAVYNVTWYMDGKPVKHDTLTNQERDAYYDLSEWEGHINQKLSCGVLTYYQSRQNITSTETTSNSYYGGITVEPTPLLLTEGQDKTVYVVSTLPVSCGEFQQESLCKLDLHVLSSNLYTTGGCGLSFTSTDWNSTIHEARIPLEIAAVVDPAVKPNYHAHFTIHIGGATSLAPSLNIWRNVTNGQTQVIVTDGHTKSCVCTGDPHFSAGFNFHSKYNLYHLGDFNFASDMKAPIAIQIETNTYHPTHLPIISALAIQTGNDVTIIDTYGGSKMATVSTFQASTTQLVQACGTNEYQISTPTGHRINVYPRGRAGRGYYLDVRLAFPGDVIPMTHFTIQNNKSVPLVSLDTCGTGPITDGKHSFGHRKEISSAIIDKFRVPPNANLFKGDKLSLPHVPNKLYCSCVAGTNGTGVMAQCTKTKAKDPLINRPTCKTFHPKVEIRPQAQTRPGENFFKEYQPSLHSWPTASGITEIQARARCQHTITSHVPVQCLHMKNLDIRDVIDDCAEDILASNGFEYVASAAEAFKAMCESTLLANPNSYIHSKPPDVVTNECPNLCNLHGACVNGKCQCEAGWSWEDCSVNNGQPFKITEIDGGLTCDTSVSDDCFEPLLKVQNLGHVNGCFIDTKGYKQGRPFTDESSSQATTERINGPTIRVTLPRQTSFAKFYRIELIGNMTTQSIGYVVYDGICQKCTSDFTCYQKENACLINGQCYMNGESNYKDRSLVCKPDATMDGWTNINQATTQNIPGIQHLQIGR